MKEYNKLIRDRIIELIEHDNLKYSSRLLNEEEYKVELVNKLVEESKEVRDSIGSKAELIKEIADVQEVIEYIVKTFELDEAEILLVKDERKNKRGGFDKRIFLESMEEKKTD